MDDKERKELDELHRQLGWLTIAVLGCAIYIGTQALMQLIERFA